MSGASSSASGPGEPGQSTAHTRGNTACDACKRRKLRCTGDQPCDPCRATGLACTYGSRASRTTAVTYTRQLEAKVAELQALLRQQPNIEPEDEISVEQSRSQARDNLIETLVGPGDDYIYLTLQDEPDSFHGRFAGLSLLRSVTDLCDQLADFPGNHYGKTMAEAFDSNVMDTPTYNQIASFALLPSPQVMKTAIQSALNGALSCQECIDRTELRGQVERLYSCDPEQYTPSDRRALALVYALLALGRQRSEDENPSYLDAGVYVMKGISYFRASRALLDSMDCNHLDCIRTVICLTNYLLSASMASRAYTCICVGVAAALRLGLHVYSPSSREQFSASELFQRRRVFAVLNCAQTYLASVLGMPLILKDADVEQTIPLPEEELHDEGKSLFGRDPFSPITSAIHLSRLFRISADVTKSHFPDHKANSESTGSYSLSYYDVTKWENQLNEWLADLPPLSPETMDETALRSQLVLRFCNFAQRIAIYRPFLQHVIRSRQDPNFDPRGHEFGNACLHASQGAIEHAVLMDGYGVLNNAMWYVIYNVALAASALMLVVLRTSGDETEVERAHTAVSQAQEVLTKLGRSSLSAKKCAESLQALQAEATIHREEPASPKTQFMQAIGAMEY